MTARSGTAKFAKAVVENAFNEGIIRKDVSLKELMSMIPDDGDMELRGGVLAWSGWALVYPSMTKAEEK